MPFLDALPEPVSNPCHAHIATASATPGAVVVTPLSMQRTAELTDQARSHRETWTRQPLVWPAPHEARGLRYEIGARHRLPVHHHPFPRFGWVIEGTLRVTNTETGKELLLRPGDRIAESVAQGHFGEAVGPERVVLDVVDIVPPGHGSNTAMGEPPAPTSARRPTPRNLGGARQ